MIKSLIKTLRRRPKETRNNIAFVVAALFTGGVFAVWAYTSSWSYEEAGRQQAAEGTSAFSTFFDSIQDQMPDYESIVEQTETGGENAFGKRTGMPENTSSDGSLDIQQKLEIEAYLRAQEQKNAQETTDTPPLETQPQEEAVTDGGRYVRIVTVPSPTTSPADIE